MNFYKFCGFYAFFVLALVALVSAQKSCHHAYLDDPENINDVYFPHPTDCRFYYQCTAHGKVRMKCQPGMHFDIETSHCGRPDDVVCGSDDSKKRY